MGTPQYKDIALWKEADVLALPTGEHDWLEFKASKWFDAKKEERFVDASKYFSAWVNYDGGYMVIGVINPRAGEPLEVDGGVPVIAKGEQDVKEWFENKLPSLLDPALEKFSVQLIVPESSKSAIASGSCIVIIHIPPSSVAPHQASDNKYYTRAGSHLAPLGNRAVLDILGRRKHPRIELLLRVNVDELDLKSAVCWKLTNTGPVAARNFLLIVDPPFYLNVRAFDFGNGVAQLHVDDSDGPTFWRIEAINDPARLLFSGGEYTGTAPFETARASNVKTILEVRYQIFADDMPVEKGIFELKEITHRFNSTPYRRN